MVYGRRMQIRQLTGNWWFPVLAALIFFAVIILPRLAPPTPAKALVGKTAPELGFILNGSTSSLGALRGRTVLLHFWAGWCQPCLQEMPLLAELETSLASQDFTLIAVDVDPPVSGPSELPQKLPHPKNLVVGTDPDALRAYVSSVPVSVLIDKTGVIREVFAGPQAWNDNSMQARVRGLQ